MRKFLLPFLLLPLGLAHAQSVRDVQIAPSTNSTFGAALNVTGNNEVSLYNTSSSGSNLDSFRFWQGIYSGSNQLLLDLTPTGAVFGTPTGGSKGAGTVNAQGLYINGVAVTTTTAAGGTNGQVQYNSSGVLAGFTVSGDATLNTSTGALTLATVNANVGSFGSATNCATITVNAKGLITAASAATCTPAIGSVTGLGTGVATALGTAVGTAGSPVVNGGALGTPSSGTATNLTGTASGLTAGTVTTNANLTGAITSTGNATSLGSFTSANLRGALTDESGTGAAYFQGGDIGTPSAGVGTNLTALNATNLTSGTVAAARQPAYTGDCSASAGSTALTCTGVGGATVSGSVIRVTGVNFNSANTDTTVNIPTTPNAAYATSQVGIYNCTGSITTATFQLFTAAAGGGVALSSLTTGAITATGPAANNSFQGMGTSTPTWLNQSQLFFRVVTPQGSAVTCSIAVRLNYL